MKSLAKTLTYLVLSYAVCAFLFWQLNPADWSQRWLFFAVFFIYILIESFAEVMREREREKSAEQELAKKSGV